MASFSVPPALALVAAVACASRPTLEPTEASSTAPIESSPMTPADTANPEAAAPAEPVAPAPATATTSAPVDATPSPSPTVADPNDPTTPAPPATDSKRTPGVGSGAIVVRGQLHPSRIQAAMRTAYPAVRECHRSALKNGTVENTPIRVQLNFVINRDGVVTKLTDNSENLDPAFSSCILKAVQAEKFQPPQRGVASVSYPLELTTP